MSASKRGWRCRWLLLSLLPFGLGSWIPIWVGLRRRVRSWTVFGVLWLVFTLAGWVLVGVEPPGSTGKDISGALIVLAWCGGIVTSLAIRLGYNRNNGRSKPVRAPWPEPTYRSRQWPALYALFAYIFTFVGRVGLPSALYYGLGIHIHVGASVLLGDTLLIGSLLPLRLRYGLSRDDLGIRAAPVARSIGLVVLSLVAYGVISFLWPMLVAQSGVGVFADVKYEGSVNVGLAIIAAAVSAPVAEEIFFRGVLYRSLRNRLSILPAAMLAGALFGFVHITRFPLEALPVQAAFGVIACLLYERTGSLLPGIALHSFVDASAIDLALTGNDLIVLTGFSLLTAVLLIRAPMRRLLEDKRTPRLAELPQASR